MKFRFFMPWYALVACFWPPVAAWAQPADSVLLPVVITGSATDQQRWRAPASIDVVDGSELRDGQLQINLSEALGRVPGLVVQNRQNYAQDLQISIRGAGARATFGVRGVRLFVDGIPASGPDGQGQAANFPLGSAERIEVIRGPYSALYGSSSGGVIALTTDDGGVPAVWRTGFAAGADGLLRLSTQATGQAGDVHYGLDVSSFRTDGLRPQSAADRSTANLKLSRPYDDGRVVLLFNRLSDHALDPLGLSRAEFDADPYQTTPAALGFNTRKSTSQTQLGVAWQHRLGGGHSMEWMAYGGERAVLQFQAIPVGTQQAPGSPGGVIDLDRSYGGWNARWRFDQPLAHGRLTLVAGLAGDRQDDRRRGFNNFTSPTTLGVMGKLRRDETNRATTLAPYAQAEWDSADWTWSAGIRHTRVRFRSADRFIAPGNPDDSGASAYSGSSPVLGMRWRLGDHLQAFASAGLGFETPTLNEAAYQASGASGLNTRLTPSRSQNLEAGLRGRHGSAAWTATAFSTRTRDEIAVLSNTGGRASFQNVGRSLRQGLELAGDLQWGTLGISSAFTYLDATTRDPFTTCASAPCTTPNLAIPAGNRLPGIPRQQAYLQLTWQPRGASGVAIGTFTLEARHTGAVPVNDRNSDAAAAATVIHLGARFQQDHGPWQFRQFVRLDNATNRRYAGSVIVNEGNGRFFEAAQDRNASVGLELVRRFP